MYKKIMLGLAVALLTMGCATQPKKEEPKKHTPKDINMSVSTTSLHEGTVYAKQKNNYLIGCRNGNGQSCRDLSSLYELGFGVTKNLNKSLHYVEKGCELNNGNSCNKAGNFYDYGYLGIVNKQRAATYYIKGCDLGSNTACNNIGMSYMNGEGVIKNLGLSETYLQKALRLGHNAYNNLGFLSRIKGDDTKATEYYIKGCDLKDGMACRNLGALYEDHKEYTPAYNHYIKACNLTDGNACQSASMMIFNKHITVPTPDKTMFKLVSNSCEMNYSTGCADVGYLYTNGIGTIKNFKKAKFHYKKACKLGHKSSCSK